MTTAPIRFINENVLTLSTMKFNHALIKQFTKDYENGSSLRKLNRIYNIGTSSLYYHLSKRGVIRKIRLVKFVKNDDSFLIGSFIGLWAGDGSKFRDKWMYTIKIHMNKNDHDLLRFIEELMFKLFDKKFNYYPENINNKATIRFRSRFIYDFIDRYLIYRNNKTLTVQLKKSLKEYDNNFLKGFLLGLILSDGYIKDKFILDSISKNLVNNLNLVLKKFNYYPKIYQRRPSSYGKHLLYRLVLNRKQTLKLKSFLNKVILESGFNSDLNRLKNYN